MKSSANTVQSYLAGLEDDRRAALEQVRKTILKHLPKGYVEAIGYGMITYEVPLSVYPDTYNGKPLMYVALGKQKNYMAIYLMCACGSEKVAREFREGFERAGKRLDMGKSCVRFKKLEDLPLPVIGKAVASCSLKEFVKRAQEAHAKRPKKQAK